tara:strand:+ start:2829 stop:3038 length:210 start_codon:yes stop_codon:yes gene_type:complete
MKWNWPLLRIIINFYKKHGLIKTILWLIFIFIGTKIVVINGFIYAANFLFGFNWKYAPILDYLNLLIYF